MLRRQRHHGKAAINPLIRHILVEQVAMRVPEYPARPGPAQRLHERLFIEPHFAAPNRPGLAVHRQAGARGMMAQPRSEEHTSELQSLMRISSAVFCLKKKTNT